MKKTAGTGRTNYQIVATLILSPNNEKQKWLKGKYACAVSPAEISEKSGINKNYYHGVYKYLSNYAHATGFGIAQMDSMRTERGAYFQQYATMLQYVQCYLAFSISHFFSLPLVTFGKKDNHTIELIDNWQRIQAVLGKRYRGAVMQLRNTD